MHFKVIYMTGAPAAGKSTACKALTSKRADVKVFEYGTEMAKHLRSSLQTATLSQSTLRGGTGDLVRQADIDHVDELAFTFADQWRGQCHVIIDSHHVTKEQYGFRIAAFTMAKLQRLQATEIWVLYTTAADTLARIAAHADGRPAPTAFEADFHTLVQSSLAATYGAAGGIPVLLFDAHSTNARLNEMLFARLEE